MQKHTENAIFTELIAIAKNATCARSKCGSIVVATNGEVIGRGYNSPPGEHEGQRRCGNEKSEYNIKVTDKTCCVHAEQRALFDALRNGTGKIAGSTLFFLRCTAENEPMHAGSPYCTICSKMALDLGVAYFALWHEGGWAYYDTKTYNTLSYEYEG